MDNAENIEKKETSLFKGTVMQEKSGGILFLNEESILEWSLDYSLLNGYIGKKIEVIVREVE